MCRSLSWYYHSERQLAVDFKGSEKIFRSFEIVISLLNTVSSGMRKNKDKNLCTTMLSATLFIIATLAIKCSIIGKPLNKETTK